MITIIVSYVRTDQITDVFKVVTLNTNTQENFVAFKYYPVSMDKTEDDVYNDVMEE